MKIAYIVGIVLFSLCGDAVANIASTPSPVTSPSTQPNQNSSAPLKKKPESSNQNSKVNGGRGTFYKLNFVGSKNYHLRTAPTIKIPQKETPENPDKNWNISVGAGTIYTPSFIGSKDYQLLVVPNISITYQDTLFFSPQNGLGYNVVNTKHWQISPIINYDMAREENQNNPLVISGNTNNSSALQGLGDVPGTLQIGGLVKYTWQKVWSSNLEILQGVNGTEGLTANFGVNYSNILVGFGPPIIYSIGPIVQWANAKYNNAYWGINQTQSTNSGLPLYHLGNDLVGYGFQAFALMPLSRNLSSSIFANYTRLSNSLANAPLVSDRGSANQFTVGLMLSYNIKA
jgi:outer membrane protein